MPAPNAAALLRENARRAADEPAVRFDENVWTHGDFYTESCRAAQLLLARLEPSQPLHVGVLLDNTPDYLALFGGAALAGATVVGLNHTRRGEHLLRDIEHTHCQLVVTEPRHLPLLAPVADRLPPLLVTRRFADDDDPHDDAGLTTSDFAAALQGVSNADPGLEPAASTRWALIFTSGTSSAPKAVICTQRRLLVTGNRIGMILGVGPDDVGYVCMPLFHSNAVMVGWAPSLVHAASVGLARRFSASRWLSDVRRYRATWFNYTGKPLAYILATPELPDDAENSLRVAYGNEGSPLVVDEFARRYGVEVIDAFGATEGGIAVNRDAAPRPGSLGLAGPTVRVVDEEGNPRPTAQLDGSGRLLNADECVGEIVNTAGAGPFEGYYNNEEANAATLRNGWYWSGDLGYLDADGYLYFAGRTADWIRVDGENFPAAPIEAAVARHPDIVQAAVFGVPDVDAGDQVMAAVLLHDGATFDGAAFAAWLDAQSDLGPKWRPRYVRVARQLPTTGTNKVINRTLSHEKFRRDRIGDDAVWVRERGDASYRRFTADDERALYDAFVASGRERFFDL